ncbi:salK domain protein [Mycobacterium kansasii]|uniref:SalK domain protein n=1 Tax=Mycobacterium kansasii TaxID=1768 RepID=A0A1V3X725_MYCKA|nr:salK domain protein [Mycobacterium kansasii]OOK77692.1 salK domain protein [Mycobacterium kansasii]
MTYFAPEARAALTNLGYRGFWMGYFAARSAPLGQVPPEVVSAVFYNFALARVAKALPAAWEIAGRTLRCERAPSRRWRRCDGTDSPTTTKTCAPQPD